MDWLRRNCRLRVRYERHPDLHDALFALGCALICWQFLQRDGLCKALLAPSLRSAGWAARAVPARL
ncbi:MAG: hypothetical protein ACRDI2_14135 [Chloroflexota bacterium]